MKRCVGLLVLVFAMGGVALAQEDNASPPSGGSLFQGTKEDREACSHDATKYCLDEIPDSFRVLGCLQQHRQKLRKACLKVLEAHGQ